MTTPTPYDTGDRCEPKVWLPQGTDVTPATPVGSFGKVDFDDEAGDTVLVAYVERDDNERHSIHITPMIDEGDLRIVLHSHKGLFELVRGKRFRHDEPAAPFCPDTDHDGCQAPVSRLISAENDRTIVEYRRCAYCCEGLVARLLLQNWRVTIEVIP